MAETSKKRKFESTLALKPALIKAAAEDSPSLETITPARYSKLTPRQRKALTLKLIEYLKSL